MNRFTMQRMLKKAVLLKDTASQAAEKSPFCLRARVYPCRKRYAINGAFAPGVRFFVAKCIAPTLRLPRKPFLRSLFGKRAACLLFSSACLATGFAQTATPPAPPPVLTEPAIESARQLIGAGDFGRAEADLRAYLKDHEQSAEGRFLLAYALLRLDKPKESLSEYTRAAQLRTPSAADLKNVALDYVLLNDYDDADKWMSRSVAIDSKDSDAWYGLGRIRYTKNRFQDAVECFEKALALEPRSVKAENNLGLAYEGLNRTDDAIRAYRKALEFEQDLGAQAEQPPSEQPMLNLAIVLIHRGQFDQALPLLTSAVAIAPKDPKIHEQLGHLYLQKGDLAGSQREFEQAVALSPGNAALHFMLGQVYRRQGQDARARAEFARAAALNGAHSTPEKN